MEKDQVVLLMILTRPTIYSFSDFKSQRWFPCNHELQLSV